MDALRADHLSTYGYGRETSPRLETFADDAAIFKTTYSASSHTREAVPAFLTGKYPDAAVDSGFHRNAETIGQRLSAEGYRTGAFHSNPFVSRAYDFDSGFNHFDDDLHIGQNKLLALAQRALDKLRNRHYARATEINERSLNWIDSLDSGPFFCWNHYMDPHGPYEAPDEYQREFHGEVVSDRTAQRLYQRAIDDPGSISDTEQECLRDLYDAEIAYTDEKLGEFFDSLRDRGLLDESLIVISSDHGDAFGEHGYYEHPRQLHDELVHVPLLVSGPGIDSVTVDSPTSTLDIVPTVLSAAGRQEADLPGKNLAKIATEPEGHHRRTIFSQARGEGDNNHLRRFSARGEGGTWFGTYDTLEDKLEIESVGQGMDSVATALREHIEARTQKDEFAEENDGEDIDEEIEDRLSALGYK